MKTVKVSIIENDAVRAQALLQTLREVATSGFDLTSPDDFAAADLVVMSKAQANRLLLLEAQVEVEAERRAEERTIELAQAIEILREQVRETQLVEQEIRQKNRELAMLNAIPAAVSTSIDLSEVLLVLKQQLSQQLGVPGGSVYLFDPQQNSFLLRESWGISEDLLPRVQKFAGHLFPANEILKTRRPFLSPNVLKVPLYLEMKLHEAHPQWKSCLLVPLLADGAMQGVAALFSPIIFDEAQMAFFASFGRQVGAAFHHSRLFDQVYAARERTRVLSQRLVEIQEEERRNIARELHDEIGQYLTGLKLILEMSLRLPPEEAKSNVQDAQNLVLELMSKVRQISLDLRPGMLDDLGLLPALLWYFQRYSMQTKIKVNFTHNDLEGQRFPSSLETAAYRIVQEALTNVARHAGVKEVSVTGWSDPDILSVEIQDQGKGFDPQVALDANNSNGVAGMGERARLLGGGLTIESDAETGTRIIATLPLNQEIF